MKRAATSVAPKRKARRKWSESGECGEWKEMRGQV